MKRGILLMVASFSFSYQLAVSMNDAKKLRSCGINCVPEGNVCIFFEGNDKDQGERVRTYIFSEYGIQSFYVGKRTKTYNVSEPEKRQVASKKPIKKAEVKLPKKVLKHIYSFQVVSTKSLKDAKKAYEKIKNMPDARIEKIGNYYVVRYGLFKNPKEARKYHGKFLTKCYYIPDRVVN